MSLQISVVIPTFNRLELLKEAIASVLRQSHPVFEITVVDDGSTDETLEWLNRRSDVRVLQTHRLGPAAARNAGVLQSRGEWIAFLDSDDVWLDNHIEQLNEIHRCCGESRWISANALITDCHLTPLPGVQGFIRAFPAFRGKEKCLQKLFPLQDNCMNGWHGSAQTAALHGNWLQPSGLLIEKELFLSQAGFNESLWLCEDMELMLRLAVQEKVSLSFKPTYLWRQGQKNSLANDDNALALKRNGLRVMHKTGRALAECNLRKRLRWLQTLVFMSMDLSISSVLRLLKRFEHQPSLQLFPQAVSSSLNIINPVIIARFGSNEDFAQFRIFSLFLASATALSLTSGFWSLIPFWAARDNGQAMLIKAQNLNFIFSIVYAAVIVFSSAFGALLFDFYNNLILALSGALLSISFFKEQELNANEQALKVSFAVAACDIVRSSLLFVTLIHSPQIRGVLLLFSIGIAFRLLVISKMHKRTCAHSKESNVMPEASEILKQAFPISLAAALFLCLGSFDRLFLSQILPSREFATVAAGCLVFPIVGLYEQAVFQRSLPKIATALQHTHFDTAQILLRNSIQRIFAFALPYVFTIFIFAEEIIELLFGTRFPGASHILRVYSIGTFCHCIPFDIVSRAQCASKKILQRATVSVIFCCLSVVVGFVWGGPLYAIGGAVITSLCLRIYYFDIEWRDIRGSRKDLLFDRKFIKRNTGYTIGVILLLFLSRRILGGLL